MSAKYSKELSYATFNPEWVNEPLDQVPAVPAIEFLTIAARRCPDKAAFICMGKKLTYQELDLLSDGFAAGLQKLGVEKGDRVLTYLPNCLQHIIAFYGILKVGAVIAPCNVMFKENEVAYELEDSGAKVVVCLNMLYPIAKSAGDKLGTVNHYICTNVADYAASEAKLPRQYANEPQETPAGSMNFSEFVQTPADDLVYPQINLKNDLAMILYTSGTMGLPKGVMHTNYQFAATAAELRSLVKHVIRQKEDMVILSNYPMFQVGGWCVLVLPTVYAQGTAVILPIFDADEATRCIIDYKVNTLFLAPTASIAILNCRTFQDNKEQVRNLLKYAIDSGAPAPGSLRREWEKETGTFLYTAWGSTEGMGYAGGIVEFENHKSYTESAGGASHEVKFVNEKGEIVPRGEVGEMCFRTPGVALGYWNKPEETKESFEDGWWHSGDAGYMDENDFCFFVDRYKDLIVTSAWKVAPFEVESTIFKHPAVKEVAVYGVNDAYRGQKVKAAVVLKPGYEGKVAEEEIINFCREKLAAYKVPREVVFKSELPATVSGKILRRVLKEQDEAALKRE